MLAPIRSLRRGLPSSGGWPDGEPLSLPPSVRSPDYMQTMYASRIGSLAFFSAFSVSILGAPGDLSAPRTAAGMAFVLGSAEPLASEWDRSEGARIEGRTPDYNRNVSMR